MSADYLPSSVLPFLFVAGTRPEAVKLAPLVLALRARGCLVRILATGQQPDMFHDTLAAFGLRADQDLGASAATPADLLGRLMPLLAGPLAGSRAVVVQGDTTSALAGALAGAYAGVPVVHVEAGLRTRRRDPHPEELHRTLIGQIADLHLAPTAAAVEALSREGVAGSQVVMTGNSSIDALLWMKARIDALAMQARFGQVDFRRPVVLVTVHRRENHGARLADVVAALTVLRGEAEIVMPVHPHPAVAGPVMAALAGLGGVHLLPPLDYPAFVWLMMRATLALTDSGGVQEEAPALGLPVLVMRGATERPEGLAAGNARIVGTAPHAIVSAVRDLLSGEGLAAMTEPALPYGSGDAATRMAEAMLARYGNG
jgi:UDP-N-acetylglucosamine 2-epimerase (non-hydrolysing)